jgi:phosphoenolpyruvate synthase/pyruvate phosphate dikinase
MVVPLVVDLADCSLDDHPTVGGKASSLGSLIRGGLQVPPGFALTTRAYREHVEHNRLVDDLARLIRDCPTFEAQQRASEEIRNLFEQTALAASVHDGVLEAYSRLCVRGDRPLAVRSSATAEDMADASFAGQQETYLWIQGAEEVLRHIVRCWASLFTPQAIAYRLHLQQPVTDLAMGVVVQCMVDAEAAGVMLTLDPLTGDRDTIVIEAAYGLGAAVVNGEVLPDRFCVDKAALEIRSRTLGEKASAYRFNAGAGGVAFEAVEPAMQRKACVSDAEIAELAQLGRRTEEAMGRPQDIEWAIGPGDRGPREVFMLQARPETVWSQKAAPGFAPKR